MTDREKNGPAIKIEHGPVNLVAWGPPTQSQMADWFRLQLHVFRWRKTATGSRPWDREYRLRIRDIPEFVRCWQDFTAFFEQWAENSPVRWRPEFLREIPNEISAAPGRKRPFHRRYERVQIEVIEFNAHSDVRDEHHTYLYMRRLEQKRQDPKQWELDHRFLAADIEDLHAALVEFEDWYREWVKPCATTREVYCTIQP